MTRNTLELDWEDVILPEEVMTAVCELVADYREQLETAHLKGLILYGSGARGHFRQGQSDVNLLVVVGQVDTASLEAILESTLSGRRENIAPLLMTLADLRSFTRVFPIKFLSIKESYKVLWGQDSLGTLEVDPDNLRLRCQQEAQNLLMRLRRHYLHRQGHGLTGMVREHLNGFMEVLRRVVQLAEGELPQRSDLVERAGKVVGFDPEKLKGLMAFKQHSGHQELDVTPEIYNDFMQLAEQVARFTENLNE